MDLKLKNGKLVKIPDDELDNLVEKLEVSLDEAIEIWLTDEGYEVNEAVEELTKKAKDTRITATIHDAKAEAPRAKREVEKKVDEDKVYLVEELFETLKGLDTVNVKITNAGKIIEFEYNGDAYKLDLVKRRKPKGGN